MDNKKLCKKIKKVINNKKNVDISALKSLLEELGYKEFKPGGSHFTYRKTGCTPITIPFKKPVKEVYIKNLCKVLELECYYEQNCK